MSCSPDPVAPLGAIPDEDPQEPLSPSDDCIGEFVNALGPYEVPDEENDDPLGGQVKGFSRRVAGHCTCGKRAVVAAEREVHSVDAGDRLRAGRQRRTHRDDRAGGLGGRPEVGHAIRVQVRPHVQVPSVEGDDEGEPGTAREVPSRQSGYGGMGVDNT